MYDRLDWMTNTDAVYKKGMSRLYFLRRLRSFKDAGDLLPVRGDKCHFLWSASAPRIPAGLTS